MCASTRVVHVIVTPVDGEIGNGAIINNLELPQRYNYTKRRVAGDGIRPDVVTC